MGPRSLFRPVSTHGDGYECQNRGRPLKVCQTKVRRTSTLLRVAFGVRAPFAFWLSLGCATRSERRLVEPGGIEPPTSCMPCKRSPS